MITEDLTPVQWDELAARALLRLLLERGVMARLWWERPPWGVRVPLSEDLVRDDAPSLYIGVEERRVLPRGSGAPQTQQEHLQWFGTFRFTTSIESEPLGWTSLQWLQPLQCTHVVADQVVALLRLLRIPSQG